MQTILPIFLLINSLFLIFKIDQFLVLAHGRLMEPPARNTLWRLNYPTIPYFDDTELFCGGIKVQHQDNKGKCAICGEAFNAKKKMFETGGEFAQNLTTRIYTPGSNITVIVDITANHNGLFSFDVCYRDSFDIRETEECFERLKLANGENEYQLISKDNALYPVTLTLPVNRTCNACILRWRWRAANNWGECPGNNKKNDCAVQEEWRNCADVKIAYEKGIREGSSFDVRSIEENIYLYYKSKHHDY